jgi:hypothetical protein
MPCVTVMPKRLIVKLPSPRRFHALVVWLYTWCVWEARMKSFRTSAAGFLLSIALIPAIAQTIPSADAKNHIGERATVCGLVANQHVAPQSQGKPTFIDLDRSYPRQSFTVLVWGRDKAAVGALPDNGKLCVAGTITQYRGGAEIVLHNAAGWYVPKGQSAPPQLSNDRHYTNSDGQQIQSPASSSGGVPAGATAVCRDGTYSFSQHRSGTCSHHGGVAKWL